MRGDAGEVFGIGGLPGEIGELGREEDGVLPRSCGDLQHDARAGQDVAHDREDRLAVVLGRGRVALQTEASSSAPPWHSANGLPLPHGHS